MVKRKASMMFQGVINTLVDDDQDPDDSCILPNVTLKEVFLAIYINLKNLLTLT